MAFSWHISVKRDLHKMLVVLNSMTFKSLTVLPTLGSDSDGVGSGLPDKTRGCVDGLHEAIRTRTGGGALIPIIRT